MHGHGSLAKSFVSLASMAATACFMTPVVAHEIEGRMTGGGWTYCDGIKVTHGFELYCDRNGGGIPEPNNLEVNWGTGNRFHLTELQTVDCKNTKAGTPENPPPGLAAAGFDTLVGRGVGIGSYNGSAENFSIRFTMVDLGEPGTNDEVVFDIRDGEGRSVLYCKQPKLEGGNHQAHRATGNKW